MPLPAREEGAKFFEKVEKTDGCWYWLGALSPNRQGVFRQNSGKTIPAHRWTYIRFIGPVPPKIRVLNSCGVSHCVNPRHLFLGTPENMLKRKSSPGSNGCIEWAGHTLRGGYGVVGIAGKNMLVHRLAYELVHGPIDPAICVLHRCDNPRCINADHLFLGTKTDNNADRTAKDRQARGERLPVARFTECDVLSMRALHATGKTVAAIARLFNAPHNTIRSIIIRRTWKHI